MTPVKQAGSRITVYSPGGSSAWSLSRMQREMARSASFPKSIRSTSQEKASARDIPSPEAITRPSSVPVMGWYTSRPAVLANATSPSEIEKLPATSNLCFAASAKTSARTSVLFAGPKLRVFSQ